MSTIIWLIRDTFRQSLAYGIFWILLVVTLVTTGVCLSLRVEGSASLAAPGENPDFLPKSDPDAHDAAKLKQSGVQVVSGELTMGFGASAFPWDAMLAMPSIFCNCSWRAAWRIRWACC